MIGGSPAYDNDFNDYMFRSLPRIVAIVVGGTAWWASGRSWAPNCGIGGRRSRAYVMGRPQRASTPRRSRSGGNTSLFRSVPWAS
jgi:hypothetical protein